jgi:outer membrane protein TolC
MMPSTPPRTARPLIASTALALSLLLTGCASVAPPSAIPDAVQRHAGTATPPAAALPAREWWRELDDEAINTLVQRAMSHNQGLQGALATLRQARALAGLAEREALPQGGLQAHAQVSRPALAEVDPYRQGLPRPPEQRLGTVTQALSWELDLFGRIGTAAAVAERQADAAAADADAAAALLQAEVVQHVVRLRQHQHDAVQLQDEITLLAQVGQQLVLREAAGLADRREHLAVNARLAETEALLAATHAAEQSERQALAVLVGRSPTAADDADWLALLAPRDLPRPPATPALADGSAALQRRPDVRRADAELRAALGEAVLAQRAHLPRLRLELGAVLNAPFGALGQASALGYAAGPALQWDWLDAGRHAARAAAAQAGQQAAWHRFEHTVLQALADSESAARGWQAASVGWQHALQAAASAQAAEQHSHVRAQAGLEPSSQALEQAAQQLRARRAAANGQAEALQAFTRLQLALAAWQPAASPRGATARH